MSLIELHTKYRNWAARLGHGPIMVLSITAAMAGVLVMSLGGKDLKPIIFWKVLPWFALVGGPIAAFDAWGAARHRGRPQVGLIRAIAILILSWGFVAFAFFR